VNDPIERLLEVEEEARQILQRAKDEASAIVSDARRQADKLATDAAEAARAEAEQALRAGRQRAEKEREELLRRASEEAPTSELLDDETLRRAADRIARVVAWAETEAQQSDSPDGPRPPEHP